MVAAWMLYAVAIAAVLGGAAALLERALRLAGRPARGAWALALIASLTAPLVATWLAAPRPAGNPPPGAPPVGVPAAITHTSVAASGAVSVPWSLVALDRPLIGLWLLSSAAAAAALGLAALRLRRLSRRWREDHVDGLSVFVSPDVGPGVIGFLRPRVVVPEWALGLDRSEKTLMLAHEREHLVAGDSRLAVGATASLVLMPWNPVLWWQASRLRLAVELDCDARVLRRRKGAAAYGELLVRVAERARPAPALATALLEAPSSLERRITAMVTRRPRAAVVYAVVLTALSALLIAAACEAPRPQAPTPPDEPTMSAGPTTSAQPRTDLRYMRSLVAKHHPDVIERPPAEPTTVWFLVRNGTVLATRRAHADAQYGIEEVLKQFPDYTQDDIFGWAVGHLHGRDARAAGVEVQNTFVVWVTLSDTSRPDAPVEPVSSTAHSSEVYLDSALDSLPQLIAGPRLHYPELLKHAGITGRVVLEATITTSGEPEPGSIRVVSSPHPALSEAAVNFMRAARYRPGVIDGRPVRTRVLLPVRFTL